MKTLLTRALCIILCLFATVGVLSACDQQGTPQSTEDRYEEDTTEGKYDANGYEKDSIAQTFGGKTVKILVWEEKKDELIPEQSSNGMDLMTDELYLRNLAIEDRLDISIEPVYVKGNWPEREAFMGAAEKAGANNIDIVVSYTCWPALMAQKGQLTNLNNLTYPELEKPWWPDSLASYEVGGALYFVANNSSLRLLRSMTVCYANTAMIEDYGLDELTQRVLDYEWTIDMMLTYANYVQPNLDLPADDRIYGLTSDDQSRMDGFFYGAGLLTTTRNTNGETVMALNTKESKEKTSALIDKIGTLMTSDRFCMAHLDDVTAMEENRTMFMISFLQSIISLNENKNYTVLPMPMYDIEQKAYYTIHTNDYDVWGIFAGAEDKEMCGVVLEAFASSDYRTIAPAYYDASVKYRYSNSEIGVQIFDLIRNSVIYEFGRIAAINIENPIATMFRNCFWNGSTATFNNLHVSGVEKNYAIWDENLLKLTILLEAFADR